MADIYTRFSHEEYKAFEEACREFAETIHTTVTGYYHKSIRLPIGDLVFEFHGPIVKAAEGELEDSGPDPDLQAS